MARRTQAHKAPRDKRQSAAAAAAAANAYAVLGDGDDGDADDDDEEMADAVQRFQLGKYAGDKDPGEI